MALAAIFFNILYSYIGNKHFLIYEINGVLFLKFQTNVMSLVFHEVKYALLLMSKLVSTRVIE